MQSRVEQVAELVLSRKEQVDKIVAEVSKVIVGQSYMIERLLIGLLANGHVLVEGVPGLAKTTAVKVLASSIQTSFQRVQFTPDLLPADLIGTQVYQPKSGEFVVKKGPIFHNLILADEINRAPAKVQSALLECMQERQVTIGETTFKLQEPFLVMATQNPIEQEGTYRLPEAQIDRFMMKLKVSYPSLDEEKEIMNRVSGHGDFEVAPVIAAREILEMRRIVNQIYVDEKVQDYIVKLVFATRDPKRFGLDLANLIQYGGSPRASISLNIASRAYAFLRGRGHVTPYDVKSIGLDVLRHRVILSYEAEAENLTSDDVILRIFDSVEVP